MLAVYNVFLISLVSKHCSICFDDQSCQRCTIVSKKWVSSALLGDTRLLETACTAYLYGQGTSCGFEPGPCQLDCMKSGKNELLIQSAPLARFMRSQFCVEIGLQLLDARSEHFENRMRRIQRDTGGLLMVRSSAHVNNNLPTGQVRVTHPLAHPHIQSSSSFPVCNVRLMLKWVGITAWSVLC
jgi:hypothetical protein